MAKKILVAIDGSEYSKKALEFACEMAQRFEAAVHIVHVPQGTAADCVMVLGGASVMLHASREEIEKVGERLIESAVEAAKENGCESVTTELRGGDPAHEIVECAKENEADYLVIGSRGLGDLGGMLLGSVSNKVNHTSPCTCITVH
jgi:nucleotide-binding universal stress UspA family protein